MTESDFIEYANKMGFEPFFNRDPEGFGLWITTIRANWLGHEIKWWNPSNGSENTYYDPKRNKSSYSRISKYENGYMYYQETTLISWINR